MHDLIAENDTGDRGERIDLWEPEALRSFDAHLQRRGRIAGLVVLSIMLAIAAMIGHQMPRLSSVSAPQQAVATKSRVDPLPQREATAPPPADSTIGDKTPAIGHRGAQVAAAEQLLTGPTSCAAGMSWRASRHGGKCVAKRSLRRRGK